MKKLENFKEYFEKQLKELAGFTIYQRGLDYFEAGYVSNISIDKIEDSDRYISVSGEVNGADIYIAQFYFDLKTKKIIEEKCDCPYQELCKHTVALALEFEKKFLKNKKLQISRLENSKNKKDFAERYKILINTDYRFKIEIKRKNSFQNEIIFNLEKLVETEYEKMTFAQRELVEFLSTIDFWHPEKINLRRLVGLLETAKMQIEGKFDFMEQKIKLISDSNKKIKVSLTTEEIEIESALRTKFIKITNFIFETANDFSNYGNKNLVVGKNGILVVSKNKVIFYRLSTILSNIFKRIKEDSQHFQQQKKIRTNLKTEEIFELNEIIQDGKKYLDFQTNLESDFKIKKFEKINKVIAVDYSNVESVMKVAPGIDYGFYTVFLPEIVYKAKSQGRTVYKNKDFGKANDKYIVDIDLEDKTIFYTSRKKGIEKKFYQQVMKDYEKFGFTKTGRCSKFGNKQIFSYYHDYFPKIKEASYQIKFISDILEFESENFKADFKVDFNAENDWLAFDVDTYCGKNKITLETLKSFVNGKSGFLQADNGKLLNVQNYQELEKFILMLESFHQQEASGKFEGKIYHAPELENIFTSSEYYNTKINQAFANFMNEAKAGKLIKKIKLTEKTKKVLRDYQQEGIDWFYFLRKYHFAGILADDMGLGKTLQALTLIEMNLKKEEPSIVICPKTLLYNWQREAQKFTPNLKTVVIDGTPTERKKQIEKLQTGSVIPDLVITSYPMMQKDLLIYKKEKIKFNYCILDEAQMIKNYKTKNAQTVKQIDANYRLVLTGTPLENTVTEIWSIFDFLMPGFLGSFKFFSKKFLIPIMKKNDLFVLENLRKKIAPFMLRRVKQEVLKELPPKIENIQICKLTDSQNILYQEILSSIKKEVNNIVKEQGFAKSQIHIFAALMKLRQVCNHPVLLLKDKEYHKYESTKLEAFNLLIDEIILSKRKVLVFSQFTTILEILKQELEKKEIKYSYLTGQTKNRQIEIDKFSEDKNRQVFLISLKAGGVGLNLTAADNVIIFDPWWNSSVENQAIDRSHRIGQKKSVNVYRLITQGTIEEKILELQKKKKYLFDNLVGSSQDLFQKITWEDIQNLFEN